MQKLVVLLVVLIGCAPTPDQLKKTMAENPEILFDVITKHPDKFLEVVNNAAREAQGKMRAKQEADEKNAQDAEFQNPKQAAVSDSRAILGNKDAKVTIIEYSDFECPYCSRGFATVKKVLEEYGDKVRLVFKHLPLDFHPKAEPAARYFEAIAKQNPATAYKWHDEMFINQKDLKEKGEDFMKATAKKLGVDMAKLAKDFDSEEVKKIIREDMEEAKKFGFSGTPGYLINGVSLKGAYPFEDFKKVIDRHLSK